MSEDSPILYDANGDEYERPGKNVPWLVVVSLLASVLAVVIGVCDEYHKQHAKQAEKDAPKWSTSVSNNFIIVDQDESKDPPGWTHRARLSPPADHPPLSIKVGKATYTVHYTNSNALESWRYLALTNKQTHEIWLDKERIAEQRWDVMHELMHCAINEKSPMDWDANYWGGGAEETTIKQINPRFLDILKDNPELVKWLLKEN